MRKDKHILIVDDEETLCEALKFNLETEGYKVDIAYSAEQALTLNLTQYDIFLLDIMMGEISGIQLARILKSAPVTANKPVIFCTAKDTEEEMIAGLDLGADDYITKPYSIKNISARIRAILRRTAIVATVPTTLGSSEINYLGLQIIPSKKACMVDGKEVNLPRKEFELLLKLLSNRGRIFTRNELLKGIWTEDVVVIDRVIDVNITRIRQKIGPYGKNIVTRAGYGYGFMD